MDGSVESVAVQGEPAAEEQGVSTSFAEMLVDEAQSPSVEPEAQPLPDEVVEESAAIDEAPSAPIVGRNEEPVAPPPLPEEPVQPEMSEASDVDAFFDEPETPAVIEPSTPISDLSNLANETEAQTGSLRYNISIAGIDTAEIRKEFRDLISDRRFLWDVDGILRSIQAGKVRMKDISAVKAILLIHRLRSLPVHVQWEQHVVHQN